jgi:hypothetical protein
MNMKKLLLAGIAALLMATSVHANPLRLSGEGAFCLDRETNKDDPAYGMCLRVCPGGLQHCKKLHRQIKHECKSMPKSAWKDWIYGTVCEDIAKGRM